MNRPIDGVPPFPTPPGASVVLLPGFDGFALAIWPAEEAGLEHYALLALTAAPVAWQVVEEVEASAVMLFAIAVAQQLQQAAKQG